MSRSVAVDFDHVIHSYHDGWRDGAIYGTPMPGAADSIAHLQRNGHPVFVCTSRQPVETVAAWLTLHGIAAVPDMGWAGAFWDRTDVVLVTNRKLGAVAYIDDRAIRFTSWPQALEDLAMYQAAEAAAAK